MSNETKTAGPGIGEALGLHKNFLEELEKQIRDEVLSGPMRCKTVSSSVKAIVKLLRANNFGEVSGEPSEHEITLVLAGYILHRNVGQTDGPPPELLSLLQSLGQVGPLSGLLGGLGGIKVEIKRGRLDPQTGKIEPMDDEDDGKNDSIGGSGSSFTSDDDEDDDE